MFELCFFVLYKGGGNCVISKCFTHKWKHARCTRCTLVISSCGKTFFQISIISIRCVSAKMAAHPVVPCLESGPCWKHLLPLASTCVHLPLLCQSPQYATVLALDKAGSDSLQPGYLAQVLEICWISSQNSRVQNGHELVSDILTCQQLPPAKRINFDVDVHDIECRNLQVVVWATSSEHLRAEPPIKSRSKWCELWLRALPEGTEWQRANQCACHILSQCFSRVLSESF